VPAIEPTGVGAQKPVHAGHQVGLERLGDQVKMIQHEAKGMDLPAGLGAGLRHRLQKPHPVLVIAKDFLPAIPAVHHVVNRAGKLDSELARHAPNSAGRGKSCHYY
jgi:hypothetical protein